MYDDIQAFYLWYSGVRPLSTQASCSYYIDENELSDNTHV